MPRANIKIAPIVPTFFIPTFPNCLNESNKSYKPIQNLHVIPSLFSPGLYVSLSTKLVSQFQH